MIYKDLYKFDRRNLSHCDLGSFLYMSALGKFNIKNKRMFEHLYYL